MATAQQIAEEEEILKCGICFGQLTHPKQLECGHMFCAECISRHYIEINKNCAPCPICRKKYWPPKGKPENLQDCPIPLRQLLEVKKTPSQLCESCDQESFLYICLKCRCWVCNGCSSNVCAGSITDSNSTQNHEAYRKSDINPYLYSIVTKSKYKFCKEHPKLEVKWFCPKCKKLACNLCRTNSHLHHKMTDIKEQSEKYCCSLNKKVEILQKKEHEHQIVGQFFRKLLLQFNSNMSDAKTLKWQTLLDLCQEYSVECDRLVHLITHLTTYGSPEVIVDTFLNMEERIDIELRRCHCKTLNCERKFVTEYSDIINNSGIQDTHKTCMCPPVLCQQYSCVSDCDTRMDNEAQSTDTPPSDTTVNHGVMASLSEQSVDTATDSGDGAVPRQPLNCATDRQHGAVPRQPHACETLGCQNTVSLFICLHCRKRLCDSCTEGNCDPKNKHVVRLTQNMSPFLYEILLKGRSSGSTCEVHPGSRVKWYCGMCRKLICNLCKIGAHEDHNMIRLEKQIDKFKKELRKKLKELEKKKIETEQIHNIIKNIQKEPTAVALNLSYFENASSLCQSDKQTCKDIQDKIKIILSYGTDQVLVEMIPQINVSTEEQLAKCPEDFLKGLIQAENHIRNKGKGKQDSSQCSIL